jgi:hypothetical protein
MIKGRLSVVVVAALAVGISSGLASPGVAVANPHRAYFDDRCSKTAGLRSVGFIICGRR